MISTRFLATLFRRFPHLAGWVIAGMSVVAVAGYFFDAPSPVWESSEEQRGKYVGRTNFAAQRSDCILVVRGDDLFLPASVRALREMVSAIESLPFVERLVWIDHVPITNVFGLPEPLLPQDDASDEYFRIAHEKAMRNPLVRGQLLSGDGKTLLMPITIDWLNVEEDRDCDVALLKTATEALSEHPEAAFDVQLTGDVPLFLAYQRSFDHNHRKFTIIGYVLVLVLAIVLFRGVSAVVIVATAPALGILWSMGFLNLFQFEANPLTNVVLPVLLSMVGLTDGVHLITHIRHGRARGLPPIDAACSAIEEIGLACALTSLTTAIGFASLRLAKSEIIQDFGMACAMGVLVTFVAVISTIPYASITWIGRTIDRGQERDLLGHSMRWVGPLVDGVMRRGRLVTCLAVAATAGLMLVVLQLRPDDRVLHSQPMGSDAYKALALCDREFGGVETMGVEVRWSQDVPDDSPRILAAVEEVHRMIDAEPLIQYPLSINRVLESIPSDLDLLERASYVQLMPEELKAMFLLTESRKALVTGRVQDLGIARYEPVFRRMEQQFAQLEEQFPEFSFKLTGNPVNRGRNLYQIVVDLAMSLGTASLVIFVVMSIAFRSLRLGLITIIPNTFPLAVTGAILYWMGQPLEVASVCSFTVCLGIAVDDTIHYLTCFRRLREEGLDVAAANHESVIRVGAPMLMTTLVLVIGFATVMTSELPGQRIFAAMACATIASALVGDLFFLPAMLSYFGRPTAVVDSVPSADNEQTARCS